MTVRELVEMLLQWPQGDEVARPAGPVLVPVQRVYHASAYGDHAVVID